MGSIVNLTFHLENMIVGNPTYIQVQTNQDFTESTMPFNEYVAKIVSEVEDNVSSTRFFRQFLNDFGTVV